MRATIGFILLVLGAAIMLYGIGGALLELLGLYQHAMQAPLDGPVDQEQHVSRAMLQGVKIGVIGIPLMLAGSYMFLGVLRAKAKARRRYARSAPGAGAW